MKSHLSIIEMHLLALLLHDNCCNEFELFRSHCISTQSLRSQQTGEHESVERVKVHQEETYLTSLCRQVN